MVHASQLFDAVVSAVATVAAPSIHTKGAVNGWVDAIEVFVAVLVVVAAASMIARFAAGVSTVRVILEAVRRVVFRARSVPAAVVAFVMLVGDDAAQTVVTVLVIVAVAADLARRTALACTVRALYGALSVALGVAPVTSLTIDAGATEHLGKAIAVSATIVGVETPAVAEACLALVGVAGPGPVACGYTEEIVLTVVVPTVAGVLGVTRRAVATSPTPVAHTDHGFEVWIPSVGAMLL